METSLPDQEEKHEEKQEQKIEPAFAKKLPLLAEKHTGVIVIPDQFNSDVRLVHFPFPAEKVRVIVRFMFNDYSGSDVVLTNVTTLPNEHIGKGFADIVIKKVTDWATEQSANEVRAAQVAPHYVGFWTKNGFTRDTNPISTKDFLYPIDLHPAND